MFKKIVAAIAAIKTHDDFNEVCGMIDRAFQKDKINWNEHELLYAVLGKVGIACKLEG